MGVALYLLADAAFRRVPRIGSTRFRAGAVLALATIPLRLPIGVGQLVMLIVVLLAMPMIEARVAASQVST